MAYCSKVMSRLSSRLQPCFTKTTSSPASSLHFPTSAPARRAAAISRLPVELSCVEFSMMPLHSAVASARLVSSLPIQSQCWGLVPQGISMPL